MTTISKSKVKHLAIILVMVIAITPLLSSFNIEAYAASARFDSDTGTSYVTDSTGDIGTGWRHWDTATNLPAYCMDQGSSLPEGTYTDYNPSASEKSKLTAALYYGYPNVKNIEGYTLTNDQAYVATQLAVWAIRGASNGLSGNAFLNDLIVNGNSNYKVVIDAAKALYDRAKNGFDAATADIKMPTEKRAYAFNNSYVRYGAFKVFDTTEARATITGAPTGSYIGNASGAELNKNNLPSDTEIYLYVPINANQSSGNIHIKIQAYYEVFTAYFWHVGSPQDMATAGDILSEFASAEADLLSFTNVAITKKDDETGKSLSGADFEVREWNGSSYAANSAYKFTWDAASRTYKAGAIFVTEANKGRFQIVEKTKPYSYLSTWAAEFTAAGYGTTYTRTADNTPTYLDVTLQKNDRNTNTNIPQGNASLKDAIYGIYIAEDITHPDGTVYKKDDLVQSKSTDENGKLTFTKLFPTKYYVQEISPSLGYLLDDTKYPVDGTHDGFSQITVKSTTVTEQVKKQAFQLIKGGTVGGETEMELLGAGFKIYLISELSKVKDGSLEPENDAWSSKDFRGYDFTSETTAKIDGVITTEFFTDNTSGMLTSPELPYGEYVICETTIPSGRMEIYPFTVTVNEDSRQPQPWRLHNDAEIEYFIKVIKKDADTGLTILNKTAKYRIYDMDKEEYITMKTTYPNTVYHGTEDNPFTVNENGELITPQKLKYGHYRLDEVDAPDGYVLSGFEGELKSGYEKKGSYTKTPAPPIYIDMDSQTPIYESNSSEDVIEVVQFNEPQKGKLSLFKEGEILEKMSKTLTGDYKFSYSKQAMSGIKFDVIAKTDIYSTDGQKVLLYEYGEIIETIETDDKGEAATSILLPIGDYILHEQTIHSGFLALEDTDFSISETNQEVAFVYKNLDVENIRQKLNIEVIKTDEANGEALAGAKFELYANTDIIVTNSKGVREAIKAGTKIADGKSGDDGRVIFEDLPEGEYLLKETKAPKGYQLNEDFSPIIILKYDTDVNKDITVTHECKNKEIPKPTPKDTPKETPKETPKSSAPKTGDGINLTALIILIAVAAGGTLLAALNINKSPKISKAKK